MYFNFKIFLVYFFAVFFLSSTDLPTSNLNKKDANGTSISDYMRIFKDYDIMDIPNVRKPKL